jgi:hypothetical protein
MLALYLDGSITAGEAADRLGAETLIAEVIPKTARHFGRLPDRRDACTEGEFRRGLTLLRLDAETSPN